jgi:hypothetical protein
MMWLRKSAYSLGTVICLTFVTPALTDTGGDKKPEAKKSAGKFLRIRTDGKQQPLALETAIVRYKLPAGKGDLVVDLVSVVHIGDKAYYQKLNKKFEDYDVVLYELVAPPGTKIPKGGKGKSDNPLHFIQQMMRLVLDLESQLEQVDYTKQNFVHADLSAEEMMKAMNKRGETGLTLALKVVAELLQQKNLMDGKAKEKKDEPAADLDLFKLLLDPYGASKLKRILAKQFDNMDSPEGGLGKTLTTLLVADRNQTALQVLKKEIAKGHKKIAIFYGAAHMPDFQKRLGDDFGLQRDSEEWLPAWDLRLRQRNLLNLLKGLGG